MDEHRYDHLEIHEANTIRLLYLIDSKDCDWSEDWHISKESLINCIMELKHYGAPEDNWYLESGIIGSRYSHLYSWVITGLYLRKRHEQETSDKVD